MHLKNGLLENVFIKNSLSRLDSEGDTDLASNINNFVFLFYDSILGLLQVLTLLKALLMTVQGRKFIFTVPLMMKRN